MDPTSPPSNGSGPQGSRSEIGAGAPAPDKCRAEMVFRGYKSAWCLTENASHCPFSLQFGKDWLCEHPERERIIGRTAEREARGEL